MTASSLRVPRLAFRDGGFSSGHRAIPEETAISLVFDGGSYAVMMASPTDLEDFAVGFSLNEGLIEGIDDILDCDTVEHESGIELRLWLAGDRAKALGTRRRHIAGPTGCGLCGIDSLTEAVKTPRRVTAVARVTPAEIKAALESLAPAQQLTSRPVPSMPPPSGRAPTASWRCARMSAGTTPSTSSPARCCAAAPRRPPASSS